MKRLCVFAGGKGITCYRVSMHFYKTAGLTDTTAFAQML